MKTLLTAIVLLIGLVGCESDTSKRVIKNAFDENERNWDSYTKSMDSLSNTLDTLDKKILKTAKIYHQLDSEMRELSKSLQEYNQSK